jgi:hypothetical protein
MRSWFENGWLDHCRWICDAWQCDTDFALARYHSDGSLDANFGVGGRVMTDFGGE